METHSDAGDLIQPDEVERSNGGGALESPPISRLIVAIVNPDRIQLIVTRVSNARFI